jgi:hypothetical protein
VFLQLAELDHIQMMENGAAGNLLTRFLVCNSLTRLKPDEYSKIHTVCGSLPITANIPTGFPLKDCYVG